jgi:hypothetical protein
METINFSQFHELTELLKGQVTLKTLCECDRKVLAIVHIPPGERFLELRH